VEFAYDAGQGGDVGEGGVEADFGESVGETDVSVLDAGGFAEGGLNGEGAGVAGHIADEEFAALGGAGRGGRG